MGFEAVHAAAAEGDDQELRKCLEGLDKDRNGLFDRENPAPAVVIGKPKGIHGRFNQATPALVAGTMGDTALHKAAERGQVTAVAYILGLASHGLPVAADGGAGPGLHVEDAQPIPEGWDDVEKLIHAKNHAGETPLHLAATGGSVDCVRLLLDAGSNPIAQDSVKGWTPLHCAASQRHLQVLACLLDAKADPNAVDYQGGTALHTCARYEVEEGLWLLASAGCMLDLQRVTDGYTALHVACKWSNLPFTAMALLHLRADPSLVSRGGRPAALLAAREGASDVLEKVQEIHWKLCLENPDKQGLSRIKAGGQLTVRAAFDKAMERAALRMSNPNDHDLWYNPSDSSVTEWRRLGGFDGADVFTVNDGVPQGRWVSAGPLAESALEEIISSELTNAYDLLTSKAGFYTPKEKVKELVDNEVQPVIDAIRTANAAWTKAKAAREVFDMEGAEVAFNTAARALASDWWGQGAEAYGRRLAMECKALRNLKLELDSTMEKADKMRQKFQFLEAMAMYDSAWGGFGSYGDTERSFEGLYRVEEMRRKAAMKEEADRRVKESQKQVTERAEIESFPHSRLCIEEAVENLERATELYKAYGDKATFDTVSNRLTAYKWNLEKQGKGNRILKSGQDLMDESVPDHDTTYTPTADYPPGQILAKIRFSDAIVDFKQAMLYMADIGDEHVLRIASDLRDLATKNAALHQQAQDYLQEGQQLEVQYTHDPRLAHLVTFCVHLVDGNQVPVEPYVRHAIDQEYELTHRKETGASMHRLQLEEALVQFEAAHETFKLFDDGVNAAEAQRQADRLRFNLELQGKAHKKMHDGLLSLQERKYGDGHASYSEAVVIFTQIEDEVNGKYAKMLTNDAASKRKLGEEAHKKMQEGLELLELRSRFTNWMQVVSNGLPSFARAEQLCLNAAALFQNLQDESMHLAATERKNQALERKLHAQELSTARVVVVQPSGEFAPQRTDKFRRTMPYETAAQAISDAGTFGKTSTYHTKSEILEGSTVYLRAGQHELEETLYLHRSVILSAEDDATAEDCSLIIKKRSLMICDAKLCKIFKLNLRQLQGDGAEDYWTGGLFVAKVEDGAMELQDCLIHSQRGTGIVATVNGSVLLKHCNIFDCGHYGIGADGANAFVDVRDCSIEACKFEDFDERNGGKVVGVEGRD